MDRGPPKGHGPEQQLKSNTLKKRKKSWGKNKEKKGKKEFLVQTQVQKVVGPGAGNQKGVKQRVCFPFDGRVAKERTGKPREKEKLNTATGGVGGGKKRLKWGCPWVNTFWGGCVR